MFNKYSWKGDDDDLNAAISYLDEKGGAECDDGGGGDGGDDSSDDSL